MAAGDSDRVRSHATRLVEDARLRGETHISIRAGDISSHLGIENATTSQALDGRIFHRQAGVKLIDDYSGPPSRRGANAWFTYEILPSDVAIAPHESSREISILPDTLGEGAAEEVSPARALPEPKPALPPSSDASSDAASSKSEDMQDAPMETAPMSGHRSFDKLLKDFNLERKREIKSEVENSDSTSDRVIRIEPIVLEWSDWHRWEDVLRLARDGGVNIPDDIGVYEVRVHSQNRRLMIGKSNDLRMQIRQGLVRGKAPHSTGERIRADLQDGKLSASDIGIRWAATNRPAAVAEELHKRYRERFGEPPKYNKRG